MKNMLEVIIKLSCCICTFKDIKQDDYVVSFIKVIHILTKSCKLICIFILKLTVCIYINIFGTIKRNTTA